MESFEKIRTHKNFYSDLFRIHKKSQENRIRWGDYEDITTRISKEDYNNATYRLMAGLRESWLLPPQHVKHSKIETGFKAKNY